MSRVIGYIGGRDSQLGHIALSYEGDNLVIATWIRNVDPGNDSDEIVFGTNDDGTPIHLVKNVPAVLTPFQVQQAQRYGAILLVMSNG